MALWLLILFIPPKIKNGLEKKEHHINRFVVSDLPDQTRINFPQGRVFLVEWNKSQRTIEWRSLKQPLYQELAKYRNVGKPIVLMKENDFEFRSSPKKERYRWESYYCYSCRVPKARLFDPKPKLVATPLPLLVSFKIEQESVLVSQHFIKPGISRRRVVKKDPPAQKDLLEIVKVMGNELFWYRYFVKNYLSERAGRRRGSRPQELFVEERFFDLDQRGPAMRASEGVVGFDQLIALEDGLFWI